MTSISYDGVNHGVQVGINYGTIHLPPDRPETPPPPLSTVPFRRDPDFVDRGTLLHQIQEKGSPQGTRLALVGLGGVGKSQLAIEYCYRVREQSPETWVFWIHASNATRFEQNCREIAERAKIPGRKDLTANIFKLLHDWLNDAKTANWILVLDNLDDDEFLHETPHGGMPERSAWSYLCQNLTGCVMITSRSKQVALRMVEDYEIIPVEPMNETHAISLFEKKIGTQTDPLGILQLVAALEFMPLAIVQAAAFIKQRAPRESITQYLERFQKSDKQKIRLLDYEGGHIRRDLEAKNSILVTWEISFDDIRGRRSSAANLLSLMSFFDRQGIPDSLLREDQATKQTNKESDSSDTDDDESFFEEIDRFESDILLLKDYSMISETSDHGIFQMHRLVQLGMQKWLKNQESLEHWKGLCIRRLFQNFPEERLENWEECQTLSPHVHCAMMHQPAGKASLKEWASLLHKAASFICMMQGCIDVTEMARKALKARGTLFGEENEETIQSSETLVEAFRILGKSREAENLQLRVIETRRRAFGPEDPTTFSSMSELASIYREQGRWKEAEELKQQMMETSRQALGPMQPTTLSIMNDLASIYERNGRYKEAEELQLEVVESSNQVFGPEHDITLSRLSLLSSIYEAQGRWSEAEEVEGKVMETRKKTLGPAHIWTLASMGNMGSIYQWQGRWKEAEELQVQVNEVREQVLGPEHPSTLSSMDYLASTYSGQGRWKEARELQLRVNQTRERVLGPEHFVTVAGVTKLAGILEKEAAQRMDSNHPCNMPSTSACEEGHISGESSLAEPTDPQIETSLEDEMDVAATSSFFGSLLNRHILISLFILALGLIYVY